jgi:hypothetical protein
LKLTLQAPNPFQAQSVFTVRLSSALVRADLTALRALGVQAAMALVGNAAASRPTPGLDVTDVTERDFGVRLVRIYKTKTKGEEGGTIDLGGFLRARGQADPDFNLRSPGRVIGQFALDPGEMAVLTITAPPADMGAGHFLVHHLSQVVEGATVGGYTVVFAPPDFQGD